ncbi:hypothetical protein PRZ48_009273 [Zasmidium cellare]|uniref:NADP-dependent oxidoreductase domain-containing protein n=1 Tax=Zasmidium cellare TaxID=395010 RepID=A0ABR0ECA7_ZASCE|nr:hypothetical protein PRZ48_009273 [Zasmidium cellare]
MEAMDDAYRRERFRRFGVSDYSSTQVKELLEIAEKNGQYNAVCRLGEQDLFPLLRQENISFNAYSPSGAGIFSGKVTQESTNKSSGRWSNSSEFGKTYSSTYLRKELLIAAEQVAAGAKAHGTNGHAVALRWVLHHSALKAECGDGIVIGASSVDQLRENLESCAQGPLPDDLVILVESVWPTAEAAAPRTWRG